VGAASIPCRKFACGTIHGLLAAARRLSSSRSSGAGGGGVSTGADVMGGRVEVMGGRFPQWTSSHAWNYCKLVQQVPA
jgi:hypothetical protein